MPRNTTKFHAAIRREVRKASKDAELAKMKFSEKRAYTVVPEIVSSKPHTSKATLKANKNKAGNYFFVVRRAERRSSWPRYY